MARVGPRPLPACVAWVDCMKKEQKAFFPLLRERCIELRCASRPRNEELMADMPDILNMHDMVARISVTFFC